VSSIKKNTAGKTFTAKKGVRIAIVRSLYNDEITGSLLNSCIDELKKAGIATNNIVVTDMPGAFELPLGCQRAIVGRAGAKSPKPDAVIALGFVLKGETPHFDFVAGECARGIMEVSLKNNIPVIFGVLTCDTLAQAKARIKGGKAGDKGVEAAQAAIQMTHS
jgi:6,7-dimethyl-8-ribityllumazine synthase